MSLVLYLFYWYTSMTMHHNLYFTKIFAVMEVASGEYGEAVHKLVCAVSSGKCSNFNNFNCITTDETTGLSIVHKNGAANSNTAATTTINDISKSNSSTSPSKITTATITTTTTTNQSGEEQEFLKLTKGDTVINIPNNDELMVKNKTPGATCTTSLLDSNESVVTLPNKGGFPTSGFAQFWILLKRAFLTIIRDQQLTQMRLVSHVIVGAIIGMIYYDIGNEASKVMSNAGCIFFTTLFTMFTAMMPTILTCKFCKKLKYL